MNRAQFTSSKDGEFQIETVQNGKRTVFRTKDEGQYIKHLIVDLIEDFGLTNQVSCRIESKGDRWFRIEIKYPPDLDPDTWMDIGGSFLAAFGGGKGWYECREQGSDNDGTVEWWVCRHKGGPWL